MYRTILDVSPDRISAFNCSKYLIPNDSHEIPISSHIILYLISGLEVRVLHSHAL